MNDCSNTEIRDRLPDLLHERLGASVRAEIVAHVDECVDCRHELELLRRVHGVLTSDAPQIDVRYVISALPKTPTWPTPAVARRPRRIDWRIAAAVTFLAVGGGSIALMNRAPATLTAPTPRNPISSAASAQRPEAGLAANVAPPSTASTTSREARHVTPASPLRAHESVAALDAQAAEDVAPGGRFANLNERQLKRLLGEIDHLPAVPVTEPEPMAIGVSGNASSPPAGA